MFIHFASQQTEDTALHEEEEEEEGEGTRLHDPLPDVVAHSHRVSSCTGSHSYILSSPGGGVIIWLSQGVIIQLSGEGGYYSALPGGYYSALWGGGVIIQLSQGVISQLSGGLLFSSPGELLFSSPQGVIIQLSGGPRVIYNSVLLHIRKWPHHQFNSCPMRVLLPVHMYINSSLFLQSCIYTRMLTLMCTYVLHAGCKVHCSEG